MSGQQIGTVVGGVIGAYFGYPQLGMAIGGLIGAAVDPTKVYGPHIGQGQQQTSTDGVPIAWVQGTASIAGTICFAGPRYEVKIDSGKGGPETINYEAHQTFAILVCESCSLRDSSMSAVLMVKQDGKIVYDVRPGSKMLAQSMKWKQGVEFYFGDEDQLPPAALEAIQGVGNTLAYRGVLLAVFEDFNRTAVGDRIPQFEFTVSSVTADTEIDNVLEDYSTGLTTTNHGTTDVHDQFDLWFTTQAFCIRTTTGEPAIGEFLLTGGLGVPFWSWGRVMLSALQYCRASTETTYKSDFDSAAMVETYAIDGSSDYDTGWQYYYGPPTPDDIATWFNDHGLNVPITVGNGITGFPLRIRTANNQIEGIQFAQFQYPGAFDADSASPELKFALTGGRNLQNLTGSYYVDVSDGSLWRPSWAPSAGLVTYAAGTVGLDTIVKRICKRGGLTDNDIDVSALEGIQVDGYPIATQSVPTDCLEPLLTSYFAFGSEYELKLHFRLFGQDAALTIDVNDIAETSDNDSGGTSSLQVTERDDSTVYPFQIVSKYYDVAQNYAPVTVTYSRRGSSVKAIGSENFEIPVVMGADAAVQATQKAMKVAYAKLTGTAEYSVPYVGSENVYIGLVPGDCVILSSRRYLIDEILLSAGYLHLKTTYDRQSAYTSSLQAIVGNVPNPTIPPLLTKPMMVIFNQQQLRSQDSTGFYVGCSGANDSWPGCSLQLSFDGKQTWQNVASIVNPTIMGSVVEEDVGTNEVLRVDVNGTLEDANDAQIAAFANAFAVQNSDGSWELGQFRNAAIDSNGHYALTGLIRAEQGTEFEIHEASQQFFMLSKLSFIAIDSSFNGSVIWVRAITFGMSGDDAAYQSFVFNGDTTIIHDGGTVQP